MGPFETQVKSLVGPRIGDRVKYDPTFLRSLPPGSVGFMPRARGTIKTLLPVGRPGNPSNTFVEVEWDDDLFGETGFDRGNNFSRRVDASNLTLEGR